MIESKKWFAVYTRPKWEKKISEILTRKKIENYCPLNKVVRQWSDRKKIVLEPLFTSYVFIRVTEQELWSIKQTDGVISLVYWLGKPAVIRNSEIDIVKKFLIGHTNVKLERTDVNISDTVRVIGGPLMEQEGHVLSVGNKSIKIMLPTLGYLMFVEVEAANVEVVIKTIPVHTELPYPLYAVK